MTVTERRTPPPLHYNRELPRITAEAANAEPEAERLFAPKPKPEPRSYPKIELRTTVEHSESGFVFDVVLRDVSIPEAVRALSARGCTPVSPPPPPPAAGAQVATGSAPVCPIHGKPMKQMQKPDRQGRAWWCTAKVGESYCQERA